MCGIAGYIGKENVDRLRTERTLRLMKNRGPDGQGDLRAEENGTNVYLLHTRLAIIDLDERSNQPFKLEGCALVFNGEI